MKKSVIYITRKIPGHLLAPFEKDLEFKMWHDEFVPVPPEVLYKEASQADGLLTLLTEKIDRDFMQQMKHLKIIANMAVGYDNLDVSAAKEKNIIVTNTPDVLTETTADLTFTLLMATARRIVEANQTLLNDQWKEWSPFSLAGTDLYNKTLGIVGMGRIGLAVARRASGFNMSVVYHNRTRNEDAEKDLAARYLSLNELLKEADFVISLLPLSAETANYFNKDTFEKMKASAIFINVSRGGVVDEAALYDALKNQVISAAGLDVFKNEPINSTHPFASLPNALLLPHIGSATVATREAMLTLCLENIHRVFSGRQPKTPVT